MAQFLTLLSILLLVAVFNPDKYESSALAVPGSEEDGAFLIKVKQQDGSIVQHECLERDENPKYCLKLRNYNEKYNIDPLIEEKFSDLKSYFNNKLESPQNITYRMNGRKVDYLCNTRSRNIFPQAVMDDDDEWLVVYQTEGYKQGFMIEECVGTGETCGQKVGINIPKKYKSICKQHYLKRAFIAHRSAKIMRADFRIESCCKCDLYEK